MIKVYFCPNCGEFEVNRTLADGELLKCPICDKEEVRRVWSPIQSIWKTSGNFGKSKSNN